MTLKRLLLTLLMELRSLKQCIKLTKDNSLLFDRSALVNNNVFAALAVKWNYHKYIKFISTQMYESVHRFVQHQKARQDRIQVEQVCMIRLGLCVQ